MKSNITIVALFIVMILVIIGITFLGLYSNEITLWILEGVYTLLEGIRDWCQEYVRNNVGMMNK